MRPPSPKNHSNSSASSSRQGSPGSGVNKAGCDFVRKVAKERGLRDWPNTRHAQDYEALIAAVQSAIRQSAIP